MRIYNLETSAKLVKITDSIKKEMTHLKTTVLRRYLDARNTKLSERKSIRNY